MARPEKIKWDKFLRQQSLKVTPARVAILQLLAQTQEPLSVEALAAKVPRQQFDQATLYRTLTTLKTRGLVHQVELQQGRALYELALRDTHHHALCVRCGQVADVAEECCRELERAALVQSGFASIEHHALEILWCL